MLAEADLGAETLRIERACVVNGRGHCRRPWQGASTLAVADSALRLHRARAQVSARDLKIPLASTLLGILQTSQRTLASL